VSARRRFSAALGVLGVLAGMLVLGVAPALALPHYALTATFGSASSNPVDPEPLGVPAGVAVSEVGQSKGDVYVVDEQNQRVELFSSTGEYLGQFNGAETPEHSFAFGEEEEIEGGGVGAQVALNGVAVDNSTNPGDPAKGDVYVVDTGHDVIDKFEIKEETPGKYTWKYAGELKEPRAGEQFAGIGGITVDQEGNVWVLEYKGAEEFKGGHVDEYNDEGELVEDGLSYPYKHAHGIGVDTEGNVYLGRSKIGGGEIIKWTLTGGIWTSSPFVGEPEGETTSIALDRGTGDLYDFSTGLEELAQYRPSLVELPEGSGEFVERGQLVESFGHGDLESPSDLAVNAANNALYVTDAGSGDVAVFALVEPPEETVTEAPELFAHDQVKALLRGELDPHGASGEVEYHFAYNEGSGCTGGSVTPTVKLAEGKEAHVEAQVEGLQPGTAYTVCLVAENGGGESEPRSEVQFGTPPGVAGVSVCAASGTTGTSAVLEGTLEPEGTPVEYRFQYGTSVAYGSQTKLQASESVGMVTDSEPVEQLEPNATYDCRLAATREIEGGEYTTYGENGTFSTPAIPPVVLSEPVIEPPAYATAEAATLNALINPENSPTTFYFQYGLAENEGYEHETEHESDGAAFEAGFVSQHIEGLRPNTAYRFRVISENNPGGRTIGPEETFTTGTEGLPVVHTAVTASSITQTSAVLSGTVNPEGSPASYTFEIGLETAAGIQYNIEISGELPAGTQPDTVAATIEGLTPGTTFHYRLSSSVANKGTIHGEDETFTTLPATPPTLPATAPYTLVQPPTTPLLPIPPYTFPAGGEPTSTPPTTTGDTQKLRAALKACRKKPRKQRAVCERHARSKYEPTQARKRKAKRK
jgi:hypothetical protein